jgi:diaminopimelate decarboxylase
MLPKRANLPPATKHHYIFTTKIIFAPAPVLLALQMPFGLTVRYAIKANPHPTIIDLFAHAGLHFDASSSYETAQLLEQGVAGECISLSGQQPSFTIGKACF